MIQAALAFGFALVFGAMAATRLAENLALGDDSPVAPATVVDVRRGGRGPGTVEVEFEAAGGRQVRAELRTYERLRLGGAVRVRYDPADPEFTVRLAGEGDDPLDVLFFGSIALAFGGLGIVLTTRRRAR